MKTILSVCVLSVVGSSFALTPHEAALQKRLPGIFAKSAAHYRALDAAATPLMKDEKGEYRTPHGIQKWKTGSNEIDMRSIYWWTSGHFAGSLWYLFEATGDAALKDAALKWTEILEPVKDYDGNHDTGFMMYCSYGNARRILKTKKYDPILVKTADSLSHRYNEKLGLIRSWGKIADEKEFLVIPDNMMNLELLEFAANAKGGDARFAKIAISHADKSMVNHFRDDGGCYHVLDYDQRDGFLGTVKGIQRGQGLSCRTAWSRGQSWGIYGYTMMYRMTGLVRYLDFAKKLADYAIDHPNMPADGVPYWDYGAPGEERDSSAASIMASGLLELSTFCDVTARARYRGFAVKQLETLSSAEYFSEGDENGHFLLKHGTGHKPQRSEVDTALDYGDYYYLEALLRFKAIVDEETALAPTAAKLPPKAALTKRDILHRSQGGVAEPLKAKVDRIPDDLYLEYSRTGNRTKYQERWFALKKLLDTVTGKLVEQPGDAALLAKLEELLDAYCSTRSWALPAHDWSDGGQGNFRGTCPTVDLSSSEIAARLAQALQAAGNGLRPETVARVKRECERRVFGPLRREKRFYSTQGNDGFRVFQVKNNWWIDSIYNWNAVCWDNVVTAALGLLDEPLDRAYFVDGAIRSIPEYMKGFRKDGYCDEGMGYWNYGFGHHLRTAKTLREISDGKIDVLTYPMQRLAGAYARGDSFDLTASPPFADGNGAPNPKLLALVDEFWPDLPKDFPPSTAFTDAQVWLFRDPSGLNVAFKGGDNGVAHNHNDLGAYYVMKGGKYVSGDPGREIYTARTFSKNRYQSKVLSSYGHPVPVVGGELQSTGKEFRSSIVSAKIDDAGTSEITLDLKGAYACAALKSLTRTFRYDRRAKSFTVLDRVAFTEPTSFEDPFIGDLRPEIKVSGAAHALKSEIIPNPGLPDVKRTAVALNGKVTEATVEFIFK